MLQGEQSAILSTFIKLPIVIKIFVLSFLGVALLHRFYCIYYSVQDFLHVAASIRRKDVASLLSHVHNNMQLQCYLYFMV